MPILIYRDNAGKYHEWQFLERIRIGSDPLLNDIVLPSQLGVAPQHVAIIRSALNRMYVLVNLAEHNTRLNGRLVVCVKVLHQKDELLLGQAHLMLWEVRVTSLLQDDGFVGKQCLVCTGAFEVGNEVIVCPRCLIPYHRDCWFWISICANFTCGYPVQESLMDALSPWVTFETYKESSFEQIEGKKWTQTINMGITCQAGNRGDEVTFQDEDRIALCPSSSCRSPFHVVCWLLLERCPKCGYEVKKLIDQVFSSAYDNPIKIGDAHGR